ncbi:hypothetical protein FPV67DRAFT_159076 [Lyophyllum atratum]|nr:hypothetical protein FPV67DRAFT_159076 [Lyophyllum atratum]
MYAESRKKRVMWLCLKRRQADLSFRIWAQSGNAEVVEPSRDTTMSSPPPPEVTPSVYSALINAKLVVLETVPASAKNKKPSTRKATKNKQFNYTFEATQENYVGFLNTFLKIHHVEKYQATPNHTFAFKIQIPPEKVGEARDVEEYGEYDTLAREILEAKPNKAINITIELAQIQKHGKKKSKGADSPESSGSEDDEGMTENGLTKLDLELARCRRLLEVKYLNDHDGGYTYIDKTPGGVGDSFPLTPFMMKEWARAIYDGIATAMQPPATNTFDPLNRRASLPRSRSTSASAPLSTLSGSSDLAHVASIVQGLVAMAQPPLRPTPLTPKNKSTSNDPSTPPSIRNTPSKLSRFLRYAEANLGVRNATTYEEAFQTQSYGPDILHLVDDKSLLDMGLAQGDVIRLKTNSLRWYNLNSGYQKRKRAIEDQGTPPPPPLPRTPENIKIRFEKRYHNGGTARVYGPRITPGKPRFEQDYDMTFFSEARRQFIPVPDGFMAVIDGVPIEREEEDPGY